MTKEQNQRILSKLREEISISDETAQKFTDVLRIMKRLRADEGCPWDKVQTHDSLLKNLLEEAYEFVEVVHSGKTDLMLEELGDLFMQVVFHAQVAEENGSFDFAQVSETLCDKLLRRHPHVFGDRTAENEEQALNSWNEAKRKEGPEHSNLKNIPKSMPALIRSRKIQEIAGRVGFEWTDMKGALKKIDEELSEFKEAVKIGNQEKIEEELGDLLFVVVNATRYGRFCPEVALSSTNEKFIRRFQHVERRLAEEGRTTQEATLEDMDVFWDEAKELERE